MEREALEQQFPYAFLTISDAMVWASEGNRLIVRNNRLIEVIRKAITLYDHNLQRTAVYLGETIDGVATGKGIATYSDSVYIGEVINGVPNGEGLAVFAHEPQITKRGEWRDGNLWNGAEFRNNALSIFVHNGHYVHN